MRETGCVTDPVKVYFAWTVTQGSRSPLPVSEAHINSLLRCGGSLGERLLSEPLPSTDHPHNGSGGLHGRLLAPKLL